MSIVKQDYGEVGKMLITKPTYWNSNESWNDSNKSYYVRQGNLVTLRIRTSQMLAGQNKIILTLPLGYRPIAEETVEMHDNYGFFGLTEITIVTNGKVSGYSSHQYCSGVVTFYTADPFPYSDLA